ncbi:MAG: metallophosphoesterase [Lachnospiraceae bacterium]|nr:metallophosphoesterase [Lachnospiraceae bacterium]
MKVIIVSDTHGHNANFHRVLELHTPDAIVHCGDVEGGEQEIWDSVKCPLYMVAGNNDYFSSLPRELDFTLGGYRVWLTHGHHYYVSMSPEYIRQEAALRDAQIVMYGHTHKPEVSYGRDVISVNPGSLSYPRQEGRRPSYVIMEIDGRGELHFTIAYL